MNDINSHSELAFKADVWKRYHNSRASFFMRLAHITPVLNFILILLAFGFAKTNSLVACIFLILFVFFFAIEYVCGHSHDWSTTSWNGHVAFHREIELKFRDLERLLINPEADLKQIAAEIHALIALEPRPNIRIYLFEHEIVAGLRNVKITPPLSAVSEDSL